MGLPVIGWAVAVLAIPPPGRRVVVAPRGAAGEGGGVGEHRLAGHRVQEAVQAEAAVLEGGLPLLLAKHAGAHRLEHARVHQCLAQPHRLEAGHLLVAAVAVLDDVRQHHVHGLRALEAVLVGLEVVAPSFHLHLRLQVVDDAAPDEGGAEWLASGHGLH